MSQSKRISLTLLTVVCLGVVGFLVMRDTSSGTESIADDGGGGATSSSAASLQWISWGPEAMAQAQKANKLILVDVYADWCGPCKEMDRTTYADSAVLEELKRFVTVKVNADLDTDATRKFSSGSIPTTAILNAKGKTLLTRVGYIEPEKFLALLKSIHPKAENDNNAQKTDTAGSEDAKTAVQDQNESKQVTESKAGSASKASAKATSPKELEWISWGPEVMAQAQKANKLILVDVYADWCGPCKMMDRTTYQDPAVLKKLENFITVKVNSDTDLEAAARFGTGSIPTTVILTADGNPILTESGYFPPDRFTSLLEGAEEILADLERLEKEARATPEDSLKAAALGERYMEMRRPADAARWLERALARKNGLDKTSRASAMFKLGLARLMNESFDKGVAQLEAFRRAFPDDPQVTRAAELIEIGEFYSAEAMVKKGDYEGGRKLFRHLVENSKNDELVTAARKQLSTIKHQGQPAPELDVSEWITGRPTTLKQLKGKVVLLDIFQIICPGCHAAHPQIVKFRERYQKQGLEVLGIAVAFEHQSSQRPDRIRQYVKEKGYPYPVAIDRNMTATFRKYQSGGTPWTVLIDRAGKIRHIGFFRGPEIEAKIQTLLAEGTNGKE